jgi:hypothetical protein
MYWLVYILIKLYHLWNTEKLDITGIHSDQNLIGIHCYILFKYCVIHCIHTMYNGLYNADITAIDDICTLQNERYEVFERMSYIGVVHYNKCSTLSLCILSVILVVIVDIIKPQTMMVDTILAQQ